MPMRKLNLVFSRWTTAAKIYEPVFAISINKQSSISVIEHIYIYIYIYGCTENPIQFLH